MRLGRHAILLPLGFISLLLLSPSSAHAQASGMLDLGTLLRERDVTTVMAALKDDDLQEKVEGRWAQMVIVDSQTALKRNQTGLYPNPSLQAYVNRLGQALIPREALPNLPISFKIVEDPLPYADSLTTGTVYLSTGMISLLDNESQLAFLLMHEAGHVMLAHHVQQAIQDERWQEKAGKLKVLGKVIGGVAGGLLGGAGGKVGPNVEAALLAIGGAHLGGEGAQKGLDLIESFRNHRYMKEYQLEADRFATQILLQQGFDVRETPVLMAKVGDIIHRSGAAVELAFGDASDLPQRAAKIKELLGGPYRQNVDQILSGKGFQMSSPRYSLLMSELKRDNGLLALNSDLFVMARANLEEAASVRTDDPLTMYGLGVLYRTVGRTEEDAARAGSFLKAAMEFDEVRHRFPEAYLQYAVELLSRQDPQRYPEIQKALRSYVILYQRKSGGELPREMPFIYDYLDLTGNRDWIFYKVNNVNSEAPYQLTGDEKIDGGAQSVAKRSTKN
jgi:Peptidase family M48